MLINSNYQFEKYVFENTESNLVKTLSFDLKHQTKITSVVRYLMNSEWNSIIIHERGFTTLVEDVNGHLTNATYSFNGSFCKT